MATAAAAAALRALPGGGTLDEPVVEYLAGALVDLADTLDGGVDAAVDVLSAFFEPPPDAAACAALLHAIVDAAASPAPPAPPAHASAPVTAASSSAVLNAFAADFAAALPGASAASGAVGAPCESADDMDALEAIAIANEALAAYGGADVADGDGGSDGEWWHAGELEADPTALWADTDDVADYDTALEGAAAADAALAALCGRFPQLDKATICHVMLSLRCDVAAAEAALEEMAAPPPPPPPPCIDDAASFPSLGGGGGREAPQPPLPRIASRGWGAEPVAGFAAALVARGGAGGGAAPHRGGVASAARPGALALSGAPPASSHAPASAAARWVDTGASVSALYASLRDEARDHVRLRNACFQQATQAYLAGDGALAKRLAAQGRRHADAMFAAHDAAAEAIFEARNADEAAPPGAPPLLDLHGLHVAEAVALLRRRLAALRAQLGPGAPVHVLVGTGHHTRGANTPARLPAAVQALLRDELRLRTFSPQPGLLEVTL